MSGKGPTTTASPKAASPRSRNRSKAKKDKGSASSIPESSSPKLGSKFEPNSRAHQCGGSSSGETAKGGGKQRKKGGGGGGSKSKGNNCTEGKKQKVMTTECWRGSYNNKLPVFSPRGGGGGGGGGQWQQQRKKKAWQGVEQGMAYYLKWDEGLMEMQDSKLGQNCLICGRDLSYAPIPPETESGTYNFPEVAVLSCGHVFHMLCFSSTDQSTDPPCFKCDSNRFEHEIRSDR